MRKMLLAVLSALLVSTVVHANNDLLIRSATIISGSGSTPKPNFDIEILGGRISRIGPNLSSKVRNIIDASGLYVMPGLIDGHTHLRSVPGAIYRKDSEQEVRDQQEFSLKAYLAAGVTTVLDTAAPESLLIEAKKRSDLQMGPRILGLAPFLTPEGGYFGSKEARGSQYRDLWKPVSDITSMAQQFERASQLHPLGTKVTIEKGFGPFDTWPIFDEETRDSIVLDANKYKLPIFVHSMSEDEHRLALSMKPYALVHAGFYSKPPSTNILKEIKNSNAFVITTLAIYRMTLLMWDQEVLNDPWFQRLVPKNQLATMQDSDAKRWVIHQVVVQSRPSWAPAFLARIFSDLFFTESIVRKQLAHSSLTVKLMYENGVPLVMGSDAGNWPVWTTFFHGVGSVLEMEALEEAGLPRSEIIVAATSRAAKMLKIDNEVGTIQVGKIADLLILKQNPLEGMKALRDIKWTVFNGDAKSPEEWVK